MVLNEISFDENAEIVHLCKNFLIKIQDSGLYSDSRIDFIYALTLIGLELERLILAVFFLRELIKKFILK